jgi:hypothetical protein
MNIYRYKKDQRLYLLYLCTPPKYTGRWYEAEPHQFVGDILRGVELEDFELEYTRGNV